MASIPPFADGNCCYDSSLRLTTTLYSASASLRVSRGSSSRCFSSALFSPIPYMPRTARSHLQVVHQLKDVAILHRHHVRLHRRDDEPCLLR